MPRDIGKRIRRRRLEWGMTCADLAEHLGLAVKTLIGWERNEFLPSESSFGLLREWFNEDIPHNLIARDGMIEERIRQRRLDWGMSTRDLANHLGVNRGSVCLWESGKRLPDRSRIKGLSDWFAQDIPGNTIRGDEHLGRRIRKRRLALGATQGELAEHVGVDECTVGAWENGRSLPLDSSLKWINEWFAKDVPVSLCQEVEIADIAKRVSDLRRNWGMSKTELGRHLGVDRTTIASWKTGSNSPNGPNLRRLREWFGEEVPDRSAEIDKEMGKYEELGRRIKDKREALGLSPRALARHLGIGRNRIYEWETGRSRLRQSNLEMISGWLAEDAPSM